MASIGQLGDVVFEYLRGPEKFEVESAWTYKEHAVAGGIGRLEYTGRRLDKVKIAIRLSLSAALGITDPEAELDTLRKMAQPAGTGSPETHLLAVGTRVFGEYAIEKIREVRKKYGGGGMLISASVELDLREYN